MPLDSTIGGPSSNSYVSNADADTFFANRTDGDDWILYAADQDLGLMQATAEFEMYDAVYGERVSSTQALQYPRYNVPKRDTSGYSLVTYYLPTEIPKPLKDAVCLRALTLISPTTGGAASGSASSQTLKIGASVTYETKSESSSSTSTAASSGGIYGEIGRLLRGLLKVGGVPMLRA